MVTFEEGVNSINNGNEFENSGDNERIIEKDLLYLFSINKYLNNFNIHINFLNGSKQKALIDTGAENLLINVNQLPKTTNIDTKNILINVKSASGDKLNILGSTHLKFSILNNVIC